VQIMGNPQAYDRFGYVLNNPIIAIDPSGHKACSKHDKNRKCVVDKNKKQSTIPDAIVYSLQFSFGWRGFVDQNTRQVSGFFFSYSIDLVVTPTTSAWFTSKWAPSGATEATSPLLHPFAFISPRPEITNKPYRVVGEGQWVTPQIGVSHEVAELWGEGFKDKGASAYEGPFNHKGGSIFLMGENVITSMDTYTGLPTEDIKG
jgi:hypothetical protein